jgi:hypothetical protein
VEAAPSFRRGMAYEVMKRGESGALEVGGGMGGTSGVSKRTDRRCTLVLEDGSVYSGQSFGSEVLTTSCSIHRMLLVRLGSISNSLNLLVQKQSFPFSLI